MWSVISADMSPKLLAPPLFLPSRMSVFLCFNQLGNHPVRLNLSSHFLTKLFNAKGMHAANVPIANISEAMGYTIQVHLQSYARFKPNATADIIAAVNV